MNLVKKLLRMLAFLLIVVAVALTALLVMRDDYSQFKALELAASPGQPGEVTVQYMGNTNLLISDSTSSIMIDGWFSRPSVLSIIASEIAPDMQVISESLARSDVDQLDVVIPLHSHFDHAMDSPEVAKRTGAILLGSESTANIGRGWKLDEAQIRIAEDDSVHAFGDFRVTMIPSAHYQFPSKQLREAALADILITQPLVPPVKALEYKMGGAYSVLIEHPKGSILVHGSAGFMPNALDDIKVDVLFLGVGGIAGQAAEYQQAYWKHVVDATQPKNMFPVHFDSLTDPLENSPVMPNLLVSKVLKVESAAGISYALARSESAGIELNLLPMWVDVTLFK